MPRGDRCRARRWRGRCVRGPGSPRARAERASARASQTASKAGEWPPERTSTGKSAAASRSSGMSASQDGRSRLSSSTPVQQLLRQLVRASRTPEPAPPRKRRRKSSDGIDGAFGEEALPVGDHLVDRGRALGDPQAAGLRDGQGADRLRPLGRGEQRDHRPVGVTDQVRSLAEQLGEHRRLDLEVVALERVGCRRSPGGSGMISVQRSASSRCFRQVSDGPDDVAVDEEDRRPVPDPFNSRGIVRRS